MELGESQLGFPGALGSILWPTQPRSRPLSDLSLSVTDAVSPQSASPSSSTPTSPAGHIRPSSLHGLAPKLSSNQQRYKVSRRKSTSSIPPSPLACTPSSSVPQPPSPQRSPSPLPSVTKSAPSFQGKTLSPPTMMRQASRPRSVEGSRSPLLKRVQSAEKIPTYLTEKKNAGSRKLLLEMPIPGEGGGLGESNIISQEESGPARLRDWPGDRHDRDQEVVVMRRLNLSERRDSFKKQEAVQEVSFDEPELGPGSDSQAESKPAAWRHGASWVEDRPCCSPLATNRKFPPVPHIAVQSDEPAGSMAKWECQGSYPVQLEARVYTEQEDGTTAVEYKSISPQQRGTREQGESSPPVGAGHRASSGEKAGDSPQASPEGQL